MFSGLEWQRDSTTVTFDQVFIDLGFQVAGEARPALILSGHREEDLTGEQAAAVVVGVEKPHGDLLVAARLDRAGARVVVIEAENVNGKAVASG